MESFLVASALFFTIIIAVGTVLAAAYFMSVIADDFEPRWKRIACGVAWLMLVFSIIWGMTSIIMGAE